MNVRLDAIHSLSDENVMAAIDSFKCISASEIEDYSVYTQKRYQLLGIRLRYKAEIKPTSDDSIVSVCAYMDKHGTQVDQIEAYYYMGAVYSDLNDYPRAIEACLKAVDIVGKGKFDDAKTQHIICRIYSLLAYLHRGIGLADKTLEFAKKEYEATKKYHCVYSKCILDVGLALFNLKRYEEARPYYDEAINFVQKESTQIEDGDVLSGGLQYYAYMHDRTKSDFVYNMMTAIPEAQRPYNYYDGITDYYVAFNHYDKLIPTLVEASKNIELGSKYAAVQYLAKYLYKLGDYKKSAEYGLNLATINDSIRQQRLLHESAIANGEEIYRQNKTAEMRALTETYIMHRTIFVIVLVAGVAIILIYVLMNYRRRQLIQKLSTNRLNMKSMQTELREQTDKLTLIHQMLTQKESELKQLTEQYDELDKAHSLQNIQNKELMKIAFANSTKSESNNIIDNIRVAIDQSRVLSKKEWDEVIKIVETSSPGFYNELVVQKLTTKSNTLYTALLLKLGFSNTEIGILTDSPRQTVSNRIKRIKSLIGDKL